MEETSVLVHEGFLYQGVILDSLNNLWNSWASQESLSNLFCNEDSNTFKTLVFLSAQSTQTE